MGHKLIRKRITIYSHSMVISVRIVASCAVSSTSRYLVLNHVNQIRIKG